MYISQAHSALHQASHSLLVMYEHDHQLLTNLMQGQAMDSPIKILARSQTEKVL